MEEIIIDGVDVAGCEYMLNNKIKGKQHCPVKAMPYAKETSCICRKSIDTPYNFCKHNPNCHYKQLKRLEQENARLKEENYGLNQELLGYKKGVQASEIIELKQTLQEIKELINTCMEFRVCQRCKFFKMCDKDLEGCILSLITKVEEE